MRPTVLILLLAGAAIAAASEPVSFHSPGFPASQMDSAGRLVEDWATLGVRLAGEGVTEAAKVTVAAVRLDDLVPAARATSDRGAVRLVCTAYRAPVFPAGVDVFTVRIEEAKGKAAQVTLAVELPEGSQLGLRTVKLNGRNVMMLPSDATGSQELRDWGYCDEAAALPGWAKPSVPCDAAFRNIRAGMGGVPITYRLRVKPKSRAQVVLGFCESHWAERHQRPVSCRVEGADPQSFDPVAKWGQHKPGAVLFAARDLNGDGMLDVSVRPAAGAADRNPILNVLWVFPQAASLDLQRVIAGEQNSSAMHYVDVGGPTDQSLFPPGKLEYQVTLPAGGSREFVFLAACQGGSTPAVDAGIWSAETLMKAAKDVWCDWPAQRSQ